MKTMIKNKLGDTVVTSYLPMTSANAVTFADSVLEGTYSIFELDSTSGVDNDTSAFDVQLQFRNSGTGKKGYFRGIVKNSVNPDEIQTAFIGLTINGILIDEVVMIGFAPMTFA